MIRSLLFCVLLFPLFVPITSFCREVSIPIHLDYRFLEALISETSFTDPGNTAMVLNEGDGCIVLNLSSPEVFKEDDSVGFHSDIFIHVGTPIGSTCLMPYEWSGAMSVLQKPHLNPLNWEMTFEPVSTRLYAADGSPVDSFNLIMDQLLPVVRDYFSSFAIKLDPPVNDLKSFILPMFTTEAQEQATRLLDSIKPGSIDVEEDGVRVVLHADAIEIDTVEEEPVRETISEEELNAFFELWETWDSLLVYLISVLAENPLSDEEKQQLISLLLDTRYEFISKINDETADTDFVRDQFIRGWQQLSTIFQNHLLDNPARSRLGYLSFFTAVDALMILDELGPAFGVEISRNGLIRLAKILGGDSVRLEYAPDVDDTLQELFEAYPEEQPGAAPGTRSDGSGPTSFLHHLYQLSPFQVSAAHAADLPSFKEIKQWQPPKGGGNDYLARVAKVLEFATTSLIIRRDLSESVAALYETLIPALAWQESCFRQFVVKKNKLTYLLSYNQSSVGLMQVNERVWRGIYNTQRLRWDIKYNASAGCEIVDLYLQKYALKQYGDSILTQSDTLAQMVYAMYNGGPGQHAKFLERKKNDQLYKSDRLFAEKLEMVKAHSWQSGVKCL